MAYRDFTFPKVLDDLKLNFLDEADLFSSTSTIAPPIAYRTLLDRGLRLALGSDTEKAKSEFVLAPLFLILGELFPNRFSIFSGISFDVDIEQKLNGYCDFILTRATNQMLIRSPIFTVVEAKNGIISDGLGQCIATMVAAQKFNRHHGEPEKSIFGVTTTASSWRFLKLVDDDLTMDSVEYYINDVDKILGIFGAIIEGSI
jgi:hypothetical protein